MKTEAEVRVRQQDRGRRESQDALPEEPQRRRAQPQEQWSAARWRTLMGRIERNWSLWIALILLAIVGTAALE
ncbi:MAG: hypothetical protein APF80_13990 [Alphaproteobacteria bacterium BRH_c36]|nr:MAG: hypothetical protein APF80_13990 [Alphaproteobacteria bacterium BRH_c36]